MLRRAYSTARSRRRWNRSARRTASVLDGRSRGGRLSVEGLELVQVHALDVAADAPFAEGQRHPRLEVRDDPRLHLRMRGEVEVQSVGPRVHQRLQPRRALLVLRLHVGGVDEDLHPQILVDRRLPFRFREAPHRVQVVRLDAVEVVFGLRVDHAEHGVGVGLAGDVRDAPVVADDGDVLRLFLPARRVGTGVLLRAERRERQADQGEDELLHDRAAYQRRAARLKTRPTGAPRAHRPSRATRGRPGATRPGRRGAARRTCGGGRRAARSARRPTSAAGPCSRGGPAWCRPR